MRKNSASTKHMNLSSIVVIQNLVHMIRNPIVMERLSMILGVRFTSEKEFNALGLIRKMIRDLVICDDIMIIQ